jgi:hypothetical protein
MYIYRYILAVIGLSFYLGADSQELHITVLEKGSEKPVSDATVIIVGKHSGEQEGGITSSQGNLEIIPEEESVIRISCVGYKMLIDELTPGVSDTFYMEEDPFQLEQVVVTATRTEKALKDVPVITHLISSRKIESGGYDNITGVLETELPGIEFQRHGTSIDVEMQGLGGRRKLLQTSL